MSGKKNHLSREQARELYDDLQKAMNKMVGGNGVKLPTQRGMPADSKVAKEIAEAIKDGLRGKPVPKGMTAAQVKPSPRMQRQQMSSSASRVSLKPGSAQLMAVMVVIGFGMIKLALDVVACFGAAPVESAQATIQKPFTGPQWSKEEAGILTSLDQRRVQLESRSEMIDAREAELGQRDRELAQRLNELRDLTERLKLERDKNEKQRGGQLDQLANVYGSMNPPEAAALLEQLDVSIALSLIERMPEKRIGQILALMSKDKALALTNLLSSRTK